jgi:DNA polymerase elongation subunit (family B)
MAYRICMLIDTQYLTNTKKLVCSYVDKSGDIKMKYFSMDNPMRYTTCSPNDPTRHPTYKSWDGKPVKLVETNYPDRYSVYEYLDSLSEETKEEIFGFNTPRIFFVDIETEIDPMTGAYSSPENPEGRIVSISVVFEDKIILMGLKSMSEEIRSRIEKNTNEYFKEDRYTLKYVKFSDEFDMLYKFFHEMVPKMPLITGWNFVDFDWKYLVNRARKVTKVIRGVTYTINPEESSPTKQLRKVNSSQGFRDNEGSFCEIPMHRMVFDYMRLYEATDTSIKVKESSSLDFVSSKLVGVDKIKYNGSLQKLYEDDFETFMYYNAVDSVLVQKIHEKKNYISITFAISSLAKIKLNDVISHTKSALASLAITEGVLRNRFRTLESIVLFKDENFSEQQASGITGGWVKEPVVGMNRWVACYDFASLYPTCQRQWFIAPETFVGVVSKDRKRAEYNGRVTELDLDKHVVCVNGCVFEKRDSPTLRMLLEVYNERKQAKGVMMSKKEELKKVQDEIQMLELEMV